MSADRRPPLHLINLPDGETVEERRALANAILQMAARVNAIDDDVIALKIALMTGRVQRAEGYRRRSDPPPRGRRFESLLTISDEDHTDMRVWKDELGAAYRRERMKNIAMFVGVFLGSVAATAATVYTALHGH